MNLNYFQFLARLSRFLLRVKKKLLITLISRYDSNCTYVIFRLKGVIEPNRVLKPEDLNFAQNRNWRPQIGMAPSTEKASLSNAGQCIFFFKLFPFSFLSFINYSATLILGHRMLDHYNRNYSHNSDYHSSSGRGRGAYAKVPPPMSVPPFSQFNQTENNFRHTYGYSTVRYNSQQASYR